MQKTHKCSITGEPYEGFGNNAYPFEGRCSDKANFLYVIPARANAWTPGLVKRLGGNKKAAALIDERLGKEKRLKQWENYKAVLESIAS